MSGYGPIPTPPQPGAIPLRPESAGVKSTEQWFEFGGLRQARNVNEPTLTPFLPSPSNATGAAVIVAPGGAFLMLSMDSEGFEVARWLARHGVAAFVLKYRLRKTPQDFQRFTQALAAALSNIGPGGPDLSQIPAKALDDAQAAIRLVRSRAKQWGVDPHRVGFVGFSAGAMLAERMGLIHDKAARPDFIAPIYGPMKSVKVPTDAPPLFVAIALDDPLMLRGKSLGLITSWWKAGRPVEAHLYEKGGHGFGMSHPTAATGLWIEEFHAWMKDSGFLQAHSSALAAYSKTYSTHTPLGTLLDDPRAKAILERVLPGIVNAPSISMARGMSLRQMQMYSPQLTSRLLDELDTQLARLKWAPKRHD